MSKKTKLPMKTRQEIADKLVKHMLSKGFTIEQCKLLFGKSRKTAHEVILGTRELPTSKQTKIKTIGKDQLLGMEKYVKHIKLLMDKGTKGILIAGYHGLGKSSLVYMLAEQEGVPKEDIFRLQVTETMTDYDIVGSESLETGKFVPSELVTMIQKAKENSDKQFYVLIDEFTRGREETVQVLYPLLAEKKLIINNVKAEFHEIEVPKNVRIFATGNLHDSGQRELPQCEGDRFNLVEVEFIKDKKILNKILDMSAVLNTDLKKSLIDLYLESIEKYEQGSILAMSIRTLSETARIIAGIIDDDITVSHKLAFKTAMSLTFYGSSQAMINPHYKMTYNDLVNAHSRFLGD